MKATNAALLVLGSMAAFAPRDAPPPPALVATWNANVEATVEGYILWCGPISRYKGGVYPWHVKVVGRLNTTASVPASNFFPGINYFAVQAYAEGGTLASPYGDEVTWTNGLAAPTGLWLKLAP